MFWSQKGNKSNSSTTIDIDPFEAEKMIHTLEGDMKNPSQIAMAPQQETIYKNGPVIAPQNQPDVQKKNPEVGSPSSPVQTHSVNNVSAPLTPKVNYPPRNNPQPSTPVPIHRPISQSYQANFSQPASHSFQPPSALRKTPPLPPKPLVPSNLPISNTDKNNMDNPFSSGENRPFKKEESANLRNISEMKEKSYTNPFFTEESPGKVGETISIKGDNAGEEASQSKVKSGMKKVFIVLIFCAIIAGFGWGGYYFWMTRNISQDSQNIIGNFFNKNKEEEVKTEEIIQIENKPEIKTEESKFSSDKPNYLILNSILEKEALSKLLLETSVSVEKGEYGVPVEFITNDENNDPIKLADFLKVAGIQLNESIAKNLGESFSIYFYSDSGNPRMGMAMEVKSQPAAKSALLASESTLVSDLNVLFLNESVFQENISFKNGTYKELSIRYVNLNEQMDVSIDYAFNEDQLLIGTSKNTIRAIFDKIAMD